MKNCPRCHLPYPDEFSVCPKDGSVLQSVQEWQSGDIVREKYRIIHKIGQGGMGAIYKAEHLIFAELRALKVLAPQLAHDEVLVQSLQQEARITRQLSHPNAVRIEDVDRAEDGRLFIAMEFVEGKSIKKIIEESGPIPVLRVIEIARQLCSALDAAHSLGMIHRDINPDNILLVGQPDGRDLAKVLGFGLAKIKESAKERGRDVAGVTMTKTGFVVGTPQYMSPEQAMGTPGDRLDGRSDLYSVGVVLYEALTGDLPFHADTPMGYVLQHVNTLPRSPIQLHLDFGLPEPVVNIVMKALEKDPAARFQSAREMILALTTAFENFEKGAVANKVYTRRTHEPVLRALSPPPSIPTGEGESGEEQVPFPASIALYRPKEAAITGPRRPTPWDAEERLSWRQPMRLSSAPRFGRLFSGTGRKQAWIGIAALLVVVWAVLLVWVSSSYPPPVIPGAESDPSAGNKVQEPKQPFGWNPTGAESRNETRNPSSLPPSPQRETTLAPRGATATRQAIEPQSPPEALQQIGAPQRSADSLSEDDLVKLMKNGASSKALVELVQKYGIGFQADEPTLDRLRKEDAPDALIDTLRGTRPPSQPKPAENPPREDSSKVFEAARHLKLGQLKAQDKDFDGALAEFAQAEKIRPQWADIFYQRGLLFAELHRYDEAADEWKRYSASSGPEADAKTVQDKIVEWQYQAEKGQKIRRLRDKGAQSLKRFNAEGAIAAFQELVKAQPSLENLLLLADAFWMKRDYESLSKTVSQASVLDQNSAQAILYQGAVELGGGRIGNALSTIQRGIGLDPNSAFGYELNCDALRRKGDWKNAWLQCERALQINPNSGFAHNRLGWILWNRRDRSAGLVELRKAVEAEPANAYWQSDLAYALVPLGDIDAARRAAREALRLDAKCPYSHDAMGMVLEAQGNVEEAILEFNEAIRLGPVDRTMFLEHLNHAMRTKKPAR